MKYAIEYRPMTGMISHVEYCEDWEEVLRVLQDEEVYIEDDESSTLTIRIPYQPRD